MATALRSCRSSWVNMPLRSRKRFASAPPQAPSTTWIRVMHSIICSNSQRMLLQYCNASKAMARWHNSTSSSSTASTFLPPSSLRRIDMISMSNAVRDARNAVTRRRFVQQVFAKKDIICVRIIASNRVAEEQSQCEGTTSNQRPCLLRPELPCDMVVVVLSSSRR